MYLIMDDIQCVLFSGFPPLRSSHSESTVPNITRLPDSPPKRLVKLNISSETYEDNVLQ